MTAELFTTGQMRQADALTISGGTPGYVLMTRAGEAVAAAGRGMLRGGRRVLVVAGPGNNGGDGFVAARLLAEAGLEVTVALLGHRENLRGDAAHSAADWSGAVVPLAEARPEGADLVIDALFGAGLARDVSSEAASVVEAINASGRPVLAVDIPSGIDGDTGAVRGAAVRASRTVTFVRRKPGHLLLPGRLHCGPVEVADIGIADETVAGLGIRTFANEPALWRDGFPVPEEGGHKYSRGHTLVVSGGMLHTGAARLAARAALRVGSGLVTVAAPSDALAAHAAHLTAIMLRRCDDPRGLSALLADRRLNAVALGPALGVGEATREMVAAALAAGRAVVLDADAVTSFEGEARRLAGLIAEAPGVTVLTPHDGEFARLFAGWPEMTLGSKLDRVRRAAEALGATILLKGPDTVVAGPDGRAAINENGTAYLATAGSGDVLTGLIGGLLAQGMPCFEAACAGVWLHGEAGTAFGPGLIAEDLPEGVPAVLGALLSTREPG